MKRSQLYRNCTITSTLLTLVFGTLAFWFYQRSEASRIFEKDFYISTDELLLGTEPFTEELKLDLQSLSQLKLKSVSADIKVEYQGHSKTSGISSENTKDTSAVPPTANRNSSSIATLKLQGSVPVRKGESERLRLLSAHRNGSEFDITVHESRIKNSSIKVNMKSSLVVANSELELRVILPREFENQVKIHTTSGDIEVVNPKFSGLAIESVSGDVEIEIPKKFGAEIKLESVSGELRSELGEIGQALTLEERPGRKTLQGRIGSGVSKVEGKTISGDLTVTTD